MRLQVTAAIRDAICNLQYTPGQRLVERELVEKYGVSRATIREVLQALSSEGLVTVIPQRGATVTEPNAEDARDLYEIRSVLECLLVSKFCERASRAQRLRLAVAVEEFAEAVDAGLPITETMKVKDRFYDVLLDGAASPSLWQVIEGIQARVHVLRATSMSATGRGETAVKELRAVSDAVEAGDTEAAVAAYRHHIEQAGKTALQRLTEPPESAANERAS
ncbi:GntR family transcriptional regulator [Paenarthrobacter sp. DKR-5]|nr:GntR family transcriptional regulator [Paenarthrobacter sp. DKR-5]